MGCVKVGGSGGIDIEEDIVVGWGGFLGLRCGWGGNEDGDVVEMGREGSWRGFEETG